MGRIRKDEYYVGLALAVSKRSTCIRRHYGCVIVNDDCVIATGYNGNPRGEVNCCDIEECRRSGAERYSSYEECNAVHAEQNALLAARRKDMIGGTLYIACEEARQIDMYKHPGDNPPTGVIWVEDDSPRPCKMCFNMVKNAGIVKIVNRKGEVWNAQSDSPLL